MSARRSAEGRARDVRRLLEAARALVAGLGAGDARRRAPLVRALVETTGLSPEGVLLALERHLEVDATDAHVHSLVVSAGEAPHVAVVLSANVFVGALRAIALARAAAEDVVVRPSRRDPTFARALVAAARAAGDDAIRIDEALAVDAVESGELHVYGRDETLADVVRRARPGVRVRGHGSGMGVAWITRRAALDEAARDLAADVVVFDQQGCLSPRLALVEGGPGEAARFADALDAALDEAASRVPRGRVPEDVRAGAARWLATLAYAGEIRQGASHAVGVAPPGAPLVLPPTHRHVHVMPVGGDEAARAAVAPLARGVVAVGSDDVAAALAVAPSWARASRLGVVQRPPLDGPVDRRGLG